MASPHRVLLTAAGTATAFGVLASLKEHWPDAHIVVGDMAAPELIAASSVADVAVQVPPVTSPELAEVLSALLDEHAITAYLPILESELVLAARLREGNTLPAELAVAAPSVRSAETCFDKLETARWLGGAGIPAAKTAQLEEAHWEDAPLVAKSRFGAGSIDVRSVTSSHELAVLQGSLDAYVVQELCEGPEVTIDTFRSRDGSTVRSVCRERLEVKSGVCTKARIFEDPALAELAEAVVGGLDLAGTICLQVMRHGSEWLVTDVNARPGAGTRMTVAAGVEILAAGLAELFGEDPEPFLPALVGEPIVVRTFQEWVHR